MTPCLITNHSNSDIDLKNCVTIADLFTGFTSITKNWKRSFVTRPPASSSKFYLITFVATQKNMVYIPSVFVGMEDGLDMSSFSFPDLNNVM